ncbi:type VII secretion integral membrane protein EccD [Streptomyces sp. PTM05]|uniref:Type VII secretion integral membrane protein EccD n=1 Tax=Streptantibioticus parmotrematis TaxID=2873249 RepID=A0ABS7QTQ1_9ACTN|nr:type VII secretion integral membrane protein EccD [Streptantibioticus parmotrematis]MBY8886571.1 type VII secretion integral membrane protein EccD [Streptantibioticus parmotrematis]
MTSVGAKRSTRLSRITLVGERRRVDLVLPSDEPVGRLLPDVLQLLGDTVGSPPTLRHLVTASGTVLSQDETLATAGVADGAVLRLVRTQYAPAAPVVHDVTDEVTADLDLRAWRWRPSVRRWTAGGAVLVLSLTAAALAWWSAGAAATAPGLLAIAGLAEVSGAATTRFGNRGLGTALMAVGGALGGMGVAALAQAHAWPPDALWGTLAAVLALTLAALGAFSPVGRGGLVGAGSVAALAFGWEVVAALVHGAHGAVDQSRLGAVLGVVSVVALGVLPRFALVTAGLTRLDDRRAGGASVSRYEVGTALAAAHRGLSVATVAAAVSTALAGWFVVTAPNWWAVLIGILLVVVSASRSRAFPLVAEVVALLVAASVVLVRLAILWLDTEPGAGAWPVAVVCVAALLPLAVLAVEPPEHVRVRMRRVVDTVEAAAVIALFPLLLGAFDVYTRLLATF